MSSELGVGGWQLGSRRQSNASIVPTFQRRTADRGRRLPTAQPPQPQPVPSPTPAPPTDNGKVNFKITATLPSNGLAETATDYSFGKSVGDLTVNKQSPTFSMPVTAEPGNVDYQVQLTIIFDDPQQTRVSLTGSGAITAFEGAEYSVRITKNQQGEFGATLEAEQNGT